MPRNMILGSVPVPGMRRFLGGLAHPELVEDFRNILKDEPSPHVNSVVLSAVEYGKPLPEMGDDLLAFIRDPDHPHLHWLKDDALRAFIRVCPEPIEECKALLERFVQVSSKTKIKCCAQRYWGSCIHLRLSHMRWCIISLMPTL